MSNRPQRHWLLIALVIATVSVATVAVRGQRTWYGRPFAGILVDPDGVVSSFGLPSWDGFEKGLRYPDRILEVDGKPLLHPEPRAYRADVWARAVSEAAREGRTSVHVLARTASGEREIDLAISAFEPVAFFSIAAAPVAIAVLYVLGALLAIAASPQGRLARTFAKATLFGALFLFTVFDYHTSRALVPLFHLAFALAPMGLIALSLRLPDDVPLLARRPWIVGVLDAAGVALGLAMIGAHLAGASTLGLRSVCTALFAASFFFFAATFLVRFARAEGNRRAILRALLVAMVPVYAVIGLAFLLASLGVWSAPRAFAAVPALALTPLASVIAFIRHDLWGSRALLSRVLTRIAIVASVCAIAVAVGTTLAVLLHVPLGAALIAAAGTALAASLLLAPALRAADRAFFPSRADYKPTIEQLSEELTLIAVPEQVAHAVERTVRRWLPCERVEFRPLAPDEAAPVPARITPDPGPSSGVRRIATPEPAEASSAIFIDEPGRAPKGEAVSTRARAGRAHDDDDRGARASEAEPADELSIDVLFRGSPLAVLRVGKKRGGALFTSDDVDLLRTIANQAALALAHANSYAELELRRRQQAAAWRGEREALVETVAAEIAHEIRYPINFFRSIFNGADAAGSRLADGLTLDAEEVDIGCEEVERLERLVSGLRRVATRRLERRTVSVQDLVLKAERLLRDQLGSRRLDVRVEGTPALRCDSDQATQVLVNLLSNALDAAGDDGKVGVIWEVAKGGGSLSVWDTGPGFTGDPERVFAPWYTTKPRGTGLGLAITQRLVRAHGWSIEPTRRDGKTYFTVAIPEADIHASFEGARRGADVA